MESKDRRSQGLVRAIPLAIALVDAWAAERARTRRAPCGTRVELKMRVTARDFSKAQSAATLRLIELWCLKSCRPRRLEADGSRFTLTLDTATGETVGVLARRLLERMHTVANEGGCDLEAEIRHRPSRRIWN